jgi:hypothetical protein
MRTPEARDSAETRVSNTHDHEAQQRALYRRKALENQQRSIRDSQSDGRTSRDRPPC